uniref:Uncharacterized protein n=1 Tax=Acrobeloides nanus TaxID=290746 RepID=A0A914CM01_9BILA
MSAIKNVNYFSLVSLVVFSLFFEVFSERAHEEDPSTFELHCYSGSAVVFGDALDDGIECHPFLGFRQYCYKFVAETPTNNIVELGCASVLCAPIRGTCADMEFAGVHGTMCCCNDRNYCNDASMNKMMSEFAAGNLCMRKSLASAIIILIFQRILFYLFS